METNQAQTGSLGQSGAVTERYRSVCLTERELIGCAVLERDGKPYKFFFGTKTPENFTVGGRVRFRNKASEYGWTVEHIGSSASMRTEIVCRSPKKVYGNRRAKRA